MAYTIPSGAFLSCTFRSLVLGQENLTVLHYRYDDTATLPDGRQALEELATKMQSAGGLYETYQACLSNDATFMSINLQWVSPVRYVKYTTLGASVTGTVASPIFAPNIAFAMTKKGERANRHNIGTIHMPAVPSSFIGGGGMNGVGQVAYLDFMANAVLPLEVVVDGAIYSPVIYNRASPIQSVSMENYDLNFTTRTMRRRTVGVGS